MKRHLIAIALPALMLLPSCKDDNDTPAPLDQATYTGFKRLSMTYNGAPMSGKTVTIVPSGDKAAMSLYSTFDLSQLGEEFKGLPAIPCPGVLPGTPRLDISADLHPDGGSWSFSGSGETDYVTYSYSGRVNGEKMEFNLSDVVLKDRSLAGFTGVPAPIERTDQGLGWKSSPFLFVWEAQLPPELASVEPLINGTGDLLQLLANIPCIPVYGGTAYMSAAQAVSNGLKTVAFREDGCIAATYLKTAAGSAQFALAPLCMLQYLPVAANRLQLFINPTDVLTVVLLNNTHHDPDIPENPFGAPAYATTAETGAVSEIPGLTPEETAKLAAWGKQIAMKTLMTLAPSFPEGIPLNYRQTAGGMQLFIGQEAVLPVVKTIIGEISQSPEIQAIVAKIIQADPRLAQYIPQIQQALGQLPTILAATTRLEIGFNFLPYTPPAK